MEDEVTCLVEEPFCCMRRLSVAVVPLQSPSAMWSSFTTCLPRPLCEWRHSITSLALVTLTPHPHVTSP